MKNVLLIDDEFFFRKAIHRYFQDFNSEFTICGEANNGRDGLRLIQELKPDIALVDITMPLMDGIQMVESARAQGLQTKMVILTGYSEFEYAQKAIRLGVQDYLLKPICPSDLYNCLIKLSSKIDSENNQKDYHSQILDKNFRLNPVIQEYFAEELIKKETDWEKIKHFSQDIPFSLENSSYCVILCDIYPDPLGPWSINDQQLYLYSARNIFAELFSASFDCIIGLNENQTLFLVLGSNLLPQDLYSRIEPILKQFAQIAEENLKYSVLLCSGSCYSQVKQLAHSYQEARCVEKYQALHHARGFFCYHESDFSSQTEYIFSDEKRHHLSKLMRKRDEEGIREFLQGAFKEMTCQQLHPVAIYLQICDLLSYAMGYAVQNHIFSEESETQKNLFEIIDTTDSIEQLFDCTTSYFLRILHTAKQQGHNHLSSSLAQQILDYIENNCHQINLNLEDIASHFFISKQHLCYLFKKEFNFTVGNFLLRIRMEKAKNYFDDGCENVSLVAYQCGYEDVSYFGKCFKQYYGISPRSYVDTRIKSECKDHKI